MQGSWKALLAEQGFEQACIAGEKLQAPWLLGRQSVVMGLSDGLILAQPGAYVAKCLHGPPAGLPADLAASFAQLPLRDSMPPGMSCFLISCRHAWWL